MPITLTDIGLQSNSTSLVESLDYSKDLEESIIMEIDSGFGAGEAYNPTISISMRGKGDLPAAFVIGSDGGLGLDFVGVTDGVGVRLISSINESEENTGFNGWDISGKFYPNAS